VAPIVASLVAPVLAPMLEAALPPQEGGNAGACVSCRTWVLAERGDAGDGATQD